MSSNLIFEFCSIFSYLEKAFYTRKFEMSFCTAIRPSPKIWKVISHRNKAKPGRFGLALLPCTSVIVSPLLGIRKIFVIDKIGLSVLERLFSESRNEGENIFSLILWYSYRMLFIFGFIFKASKAEKEVNFMPLTKLGKSVRLRVKFSESIPQLALARTSTFPNRHFFLFLWLRVKK